MGKRKPQNADLLVKAADCIDVTDYVLVHKDFLSGMQMAIREAHVRVINGRCACIYCSSHSASEVQK